MSAETAIKHKGFHLGACLHSHDSFPAGDGCNPNCPRLLHAEIDRLRVEQNGSEWVHLMTGTTCSCAHVKVGMTVTESRNWNPDCPEHGTQSDWYLSPEQVAKRREQNERLVDLQRRARAARRAAKNGGDRP